MFGEIWNTVEGKDPLFSIIPTLVSTKQLQKTEHCFFADSPIFIADSPIFIANLVGRAGGKKSINAKHSKSSRTVSKLPEA